jgi:hypothetical protein
MRAYQTVINIAGSNINAELLPVSRLKYTTRIVLCVQVVAVDIYNSVSIKTCLT